MPDQDRTLRTVEIKEDITSRNNAQAAGLRQALEDRGIFYLNVMSSPGSGKTTLLVSLIERLREDYRIGVIEADIDSDVDAQTIQKTGVRTIQMHTAGACHITCQMSREALEALGLEGLDIVILENIGNLVCPAEFDTGAGKNLVLLSVPEGDDKPLKYPLMFEVASAVAVTKTDVAPVFDFSVERARENIRRRNPEAPVFFTSALTGDGVGEVEAYIRRETDKVKRAKKQI
ncbi:MAG: hydrogenase nickel incorporation protein HypB [Faecousia sp.]